MSDIHLPRNRGPEDEEPQPEVRLELTRAGVDQVLSLYSSERDAGRGDGFSFRLEDIERAIRERRRMLAIGLAGGLGLAVLVILFSTPLYPVSARIVLEQQDVSTDDTAISARTAGSSFIATQAEVMESRSVVERALEKIPRAPYLDEDDDAVAEAEESIDVTPISQTQVVALAYLGPDPAHGVRLLEALVEAYREVVSRNDRASQAQKLRAKQAEIEVLESQAEEMESRLASLRSDNEILGSGDEAAEAQAQILDDQMRQLTEVRRERIALESRLAAGGEETAELDPATRSLQQDLWEAEAELARAEQTLKPRHPSVESARRRVQVLRRQIRASKEARPEALRREIEATRSLEDELRAAYEAERQRMADIERHRRQETALLEAIERIRTMSDARRRELLDQRLVSRLAEEGETSITARVIEPPKLPKEPVWPRNKLVLAGGAGLGLAAGFLAALFSLQRSRQVWVGPAPPEPRRSPAA